MCVPVVAMRIVDCATIHGAGGALKTKLQQFNKPLGRQLQLQVEGSFTVMRSEGQFVTRKQTILVLVYDNH